MHSTGLNLLLISVMAIIMPVVLALQNGCGMKARIPILQSRQYNIRRLIFSNSKSSTGKVYDDNICINVVIQRLGWNNQF